MKSIYLSSTYSDLTEHRRAVATLLGNVGYTVDAMEKYAARDERPRKACEEDVAKRDVYVGVFAWRYGYIPDPPHNQKSITELEYLAAEQAETKSGQFLAMAEPGEVRRALANSDPRLERTYLTARELGQHYAGSDIERTIFGYGPAIFQTFEKEEKQVVEILNSRRVQGLGIRSQGTAMEIGDAPLASIRAELLRRPERYVLLTRRGESDGIVDRLDLSSRIAALAAQ